MSTFNFEMTNALELLHKKLSVSVF